jgi:hypothetical protein
MTQATHTAGRQATAVCARATSVQSYARSVWSIGIPASIVTIDMTAKPGHGAFADHANLSTRRPKESSP